MGSVASTHVVCAYECRLAWTDVSLATQGLVRHATQIDGSGKGGNLLAVPRDSVLSCKNGRSSSLRWK